MVFNWLSDKRTPVEFVNRDNVKERVEKFLTKSGPPKDTLIYFINIDVTSISRLVDIKNVVIIDHHPDHITKRKTYTKCKVIFREFSSCCKLLYTLLNNKLPGELTDQQKHLMLLVDDYETYTFQLKGSYELGVVYNNAQGDRSVKFFNQYNTGFIGFSEKDNNLLEYYKNKLERAIESLQIYSADLTIDGKQYTFVSTFTDSHINEISDHLLKSNKADICIIINLETRRVTYRRSKECSLNLKNLATKLSDGWGYEYAAGGYVTDKLMHFSKLFTLNK